MVENNRGTHLASTSSLHTCIHTHIYMQVSIHTHTCIEITRALSNTHANTYAHTSEFASDKGACMTEAL